MNDNAKIQRSKARAWVEAMRLRTLPVSVAGVITGVAISLLAGCFHWAPALICLAFAVLAQVASNFANEYYDYKAGLDRPGRVGPRRGVTEGDISPRAMKSATYGVLGLACAAGLSLVYWGGWWLVLAGLLIAVGVVAYSAGPYPLSRHGLGELAVVFFFGIIPVNLTFYVMSAAQCSWGVWFPGAQHFDLTVFVASVSLGLMGSNVLIVNNYRDMEDDRAVNKRTLAVMFGRSAVSTMYLFNGFVAAAIMVVIWFVFNPLWLAIPLIYLAGHTLVWLRMTRLRGRALNPFLGITAALMLFYSLGFLMACATYN